MNNQDALFSIVKDDIAFDTLLTQAKAIIKQQSGQYWSDMGENDPGITLLEACCYGASDLAYRHSLPLRDLLTPKPEERTSGDGIFPQEFSPQQMLTCGPITAEDYRRALLDLHSGDTLHSDDTVNGYFLFNDVLLVCEPKGQRYEYWYNKEKREYRFKNSGTDSQLTLRGNYWLYLLPSRETETNKTQAEEILKDFLRNNRNLGEFVSKIIWLEPVDLPLQIDIQLNDDVKDIADILAKIYMTAEEIVIEKPLRYTTEAMKEQDYSNEEIFDGPYLHHGWIPQLPPIKNYDGSMVLKLSPLVNRLLTIKGVQSVTRLELGEYDTHLISPLSGDNWSWKIVKEHYYPRLWGQDPLALITSPNGPLTIIAKGGVKVSVSKEDIEKKLITEPLIDTRAELLNWGKHRKVRDYYPVSNKLPACYGLQTDANTQQQKQLHQFMLPFEQMLANGCAELALLPKLLAFKQRGNAVYGVQWPFKTNTMSQKVHQEIMPDLIKKLNDDAQIDSNDGSYSKELEILDYLLGYFGAHRAARPLILSRQDFLSTQRGYLAQQPELAYHRNNIRIDKVSALQKRIAARLGLGKKCFNEPPDLADLPFYLIEHRRLLPVKSNAKFDKEQEPDALDIKDNPSSKSHHLIITQKKEVVGQLLRGQMIDLIIKGDNGFTLRGQIITKITEKSFYLDTHNSVVLEHRLKEVRQAFDNNNLFWCDSPVWLEDMDYQLVYDDKLHESSGKDERWIVSNAYSPFPAMINKGDEITLKYVITSHVSPRNTSMGSDSPSDYELKAKIMDFDRIEGWIKLEKMANQKHNFPPEEEAWRYRWYFSSEKYAYTDRFSFVVSVVINRQLIGNNSHVDPHKLESWIKTEILAEFPAHISMIIHWLSPERFKNFASTYKRWQNNGAPLGDEAYHILEMLTLGRLPSALTGTGNLRIATEKQKNEVIKEPNDELRAKMIESDQLLYVPGVQINTEINEDSDKNTLSEHSQSQSENDKNKD
ncbi:hypothetical protein AM629_13465 [Photorhabdus heterorhabditis]|uniref:Uncharacterized protein n=1 Tax=Photorhabdus heterorhabditis TaxID=880156 RepID=A0ABR5KAA6_9GAMM|nr:hypothetical protein [Photorhabdus heterorhabditis]KOY61547.1 hypothetical protein AM629_13465 [Photorhabdus heterorhabditis]